MSIRFLAVDGFNLIRRIFEARQASTKSDMESVVAAAKNSLQRALHQHTPTHAAVVLEAHDKTWRHLLYPLYKANRSPTPELLVEHIDEFIEAFEALGVASCSLPSYEADDVIATMTAAVESHGGNIIILSTDKVYLQLVSETVIAIDHFNDKTFDRIFVEQQVGIRQAQYVDYLAMVGDKSNNIKGVPGVGPKAAVSLLADYADLDAILGAPPTALSAAGRKVQGAAEEARLCQQLVRLKTDVELHRNLRSFRL